MQSRRANLHDHDHRQRYRKVQHEEHRDFTGEVITCTLDTLSVLSSYVSEVTHNGPPPKDDGIFDGKEIADELIRLKMQVAELETENELQHSRVRETEGILATVRGEKEKMAPENVNLRKVNMAEKVLIGKLKKRLASYENPLDDVLIKEDPEVKATSHPDGRPHMPPRRSSLLSMLQQSFQLTNEIGQ